MTSTLTKRIVSALILAPCFLAVIFMGGMFLAFWLFVAFLSSLYEWYDLSKKTGYYKELMLFGVIYMALSYLSFLALREVYSVQVLLLFLGMIWFSDIGAYITGKLIGGPKLIEQISPNKTWAGFGGALLFPMAFAVFWIFYAGIHDMFDRNSVPVLLGLGAVLGVIMGITGQAGDLMVSMIKRKARVKDSGRLIPGHGGLLDRIDSMLLGAPVFLVLLTLLSYVL